MTTNTDPVRALPIETAPRDGTIIRLLVEFEDHATENTEGPAWTIGHNSRDNTGDDVWQFAGWCWNHDHYTEGKGKPVGWLPLVESSAPPSEAEAYCRACQAAGMSNCAHFNEYAGATCVTCHRSLNVRPPSAPAAVVQDGGQAVYQIENDTDEWFDVDRAMYEGHDGSRKRILYTAPQQPAGRVHDLAARLVDELDSLVGESDGVSGLHRNGDVATWDELLPGGRFERLSSLDELRVALAAQQQEGQAHE